MKKNIILFDKKENCCGCWACNNICPKKAIEMSADKNGFLFPVINKSLCIGCGLCEQVCPMKKQNKLREAKQNRPHIKIINLSMDDNHGAVISGACLELAVRSIVSKETVVETVNYDTLYNEPTLKKNLIAEKKAWIGLFCSILRKLHIIRGNPKAPEPSPYKKVVSDSPLKTHRYNRFRCEFLNMTPFQNNINLTQCEDNIKALICSGDIIWHPDLIGSDPEKAFYLRFGDNKVKRISYAVSLGCSDTEKLNKHKKDYKKLLRTFDFISVREQIGADFISATTSKKAYRCCDPVLLHDKEIFNNMISSSEENFTEDKYIYVYTTDHNKKIAEFATRLAKERNLKIFWCCESPYDFGESGVNCSSDGPAEFLQRIKNAEYVITTSFHCVTFSLLFEKKFITPGNNEAKAEINNILEIVGLSERIIEDNCVFDIDSPIDFEKVRSALETERQRSLQFLKDSLIQL